MSRFVPTIDPNKEPSIAPGFGYSSVDPIGSPSENPTNYPSPLSIIKSLSAPSEIPTKYPSRLQK